MSQAKFFAAGHLSLFVDYQSQNQVNVTSAILEKWEAPPSMPADSPICWRRLICH
ncbi:MAG: hypothetical protein QM636_24135 [Rhizobium sp.]